MRKREASRGVPESCGPHRHRGWLEKRDGQLDSGTRRLALVIVRVANNTLEAYRPMFAEILRAVEQVAPGTVLHVPAVKL